MLFISFAIAVSDAFSRKNTDANKAHTAMLHSIVWLWAREPGGIGFQGKPSWPWRFHAGRVL